MGFVDYSGGLGSVNNIDVYNHISERIHSYDTADNDNIFSGKLDIIDVKVSSKTYYVSYYNNTDDVEYFVETIYCVITSENSAIYPKTHTLDCYFTLDFGQVIILNNDTFGFLYTEPNFIKSGGLIVTSPSTYVDVLSIDRSSHNVSDAIGPYLNSN